MRRLLFLACAVVFLDVTFFSVLTPLLPTFREDHDLTEGAAGVLAGSFAAGTLIMALPGGWLAARIGPRRTVITGLAGIGVFSPLFGFADHIVLLDVTRFFQGASGALMWAGAMSWVISAAPRTRRGEVIGTVIAAAVVGELLGAPMGALAHAVGTEIVFGMVFVFAALLISLAVTIPDAAEAAGQPLGDAIARLRRSSVPRSALILAGPSIAFGLVVVVAPLRMDDLGAGPLVIAAAFATGSLIEAVVGPVIGRVSDRKGRTLPYLIGIGASAVAVLGLGIAGLVPLLYGAVVLAAFGAGMSFTPASARLTEAATSAGVNQGYASGASNVAWGGGQMIGAIAGGLIAGMSGYLLPCVLTVAVLAAVAQVARATPEPKIEAHMDTETLTEGEAG
ncbi:MAG: MFS transporter [Actinomycetota bacterium]|nr:MFS transporter [Actinomycetota bacterium]